VLDAVASGMRRDAMSDRKFRMVIASVACVIKFSQTTPINVSHCARNIVLFFASINVS